MTGSQSNVSGRMQEEETGKIQDVEAGSVWRNGLSEITLVGDLCTKEKTKKDAVLHENRTLGHYE